MKAEKKKLKEAKKAEKKGNALETDSAPNETVEPSEVASQVHDGSCFQQISDDYSVLLRRVSEFFRRFDARRFETSYQQATFRP